jgi:hypothetical protein
MPVATNGDGTGEDANTGFGMLQCSTLGTPRDTFASWYTDQINLFGIDVHYRRQMPDTSVARFNIRGEDHVTPYEEPRTIRVLPADPTINITMMSGGYFDTTTIEINISKDSFEQVFGANSMPKSGDIFNFHCVIADTFQVTFRDETQAPNAQLAAYYTWKLVCAKYINTRANDVGYDGVPGDVLDDNNDIESESDTIYNYPKGEDKAYGGYKLPGLDQL